MRSYNATNYNSAQIRKAEKQEYSISHEKVDGTCRRKSRANFSPWGFPRYPVDYIRGGKGLPLNLQRTDGIFQIEAGSPPTRISSLRFLI